MVLSLRFPALACLSALVLAAPGNSQTEPALQPIAISDQIMVDQFGFRPHSAKIVILADPQQGANSRTAYHLPATVTVCREVDGRSVATITVVPWSGGRIDPASGDRVGYADLSAVQKSGEYYILDDTNHVRSYHFKIAHDVYAPVLKAAVRMFMYQRCGGDIPTKNGGRWAHPACHCAAGQDLDAQLYVDGKVEGHPRDVHGGWHDAGDYNKYVPFTRDLIPQMLLAYELNPSIFGDDWNIPESGNGIPDILDEVGWECDWLARMQMPDGSVCNRVTERTSRSGESPDQDAQHPRYYTQPTSWATAACCGDLAYYARVLAHLPGQEVRAHTFRAAAERAWAWLEQHPDMLPADGKDHGRPSEAADAGSDRNGDLATRVEAAIELWLLDPLPKYGDYILQQRAHLDLLSLPGFLYARAPHADPALARDIRSAVKRFADERVADIHSQADAYRAYLPGYWWGCNQNKAQYGYRMIFAEKLGVDPSKDKDYRAVAEEYLHYFHGRNPLCLVYLTNMGPTGADAGASRSVMHPFHTWFGFGSPWDRPDSAGPPPGYLVGGPNNQSGNGGAPGWLVPPSHQPPEKSYRDWNVSWNNEHHANENSWCFNEPDIGYQSRYVLLISACVGFRGPTAPKKP